VLIVIIVYDARIIHRREAGTEALFFLEKEADAVGFVHFIIIIYYNGLHAPLYAVALFISIKPLYSFSTEIRVAWCA